MMCISYFCELCPTAEQKQKSFYGKAFVTNRSDGSKTLTSYKTIVASIDAEGNIHRHYTGWSATTGRHIKAFCGLNKAEFEALPYERIKGNYEPALWL